MRCSAWKCETRRTESGTGLQAVDTMSFFGTPTKEFLLYPKTFPALIVAEQLLSWVVLLRSGS